MAALINVRPTKFEDYPSSSQLHELLSPAAGTRRAPGAPLNPNSLQARVQAALPTATEADIDKLVNQLVTLIDFGVMPCADPAYLAGTKSETDAYPADNMAAAAAPLWGYRIGVPAPAGVERPRVVITAGVHARELLPPVAVANYFSQLIINYVRGKLTLPKDATDLEKYVPALDHPGFDYQAGPGEEYGALALPNGDPIHIKSYIFPAPDLVSIMQQLEIIVLPVVNPGGRDFVVAQSAEATASTEVGKREVRRIWRKNRRVLSSAVIGTEGSAVLYDAAKNPGAYVRPIGVDINRNANFAWNVATYYSPKVVKDKKLDNSSVRRFDDYRGPATNSELETCAILAALTAATVADMPAAQATFNTAPGPAARLATPPFKGPLFYLDIHSYTGGIYTPWGTEDPGAEKPAMNFMNTLWDGKRDGADNKDYVEFLPERITFGTNPHEYNLQQAHTDHFATKMKQAIEKAVLEPANLPPTKVNKAGKPDEKDSRYQLGLHCNYATGSSAAALYETPGTANDYAPALNIKGITNLMTPGAGKDTVYTNPERNGPAIGLTIETGMLGDGGFAPVDAKNSDSKTEDGTPYTSCGSYSKVERETLAALHTFLLQSISYAKK